jgi:hypothetical protein
MWKNLFDTCVVWSCVTRCRCGTTSSTLFTVLSQCELALTHWARYTNHYSEMRMADAPPPPHYSWLPFKIQWRPLPSSSSLQFLHGSSNPHRLNRSDFGIFLNWVQGPGGGGGGGAGIPVRKRATWDRQAARQAPCQHSLSRASWPIAYFSQIKREGRMSASREKKSMASCIRLYII